MSIDMMMEQFSKDVSAQMGVLRATWKNIVGDNASRSGALSGSIGLVPYYKLIWSMLKGCDIGTPATVDQMLTGYIGDTCWEALPADARSADNKPFRDLLIVAHLTNFYSLPSILHPYERQPVFGDTSSDCPLNGELKRWRAMEARLGDPNQAGITPELVGNYCETHRLGDFYALLQAATMENSFWLISAKSGKFQHIQQLQKGFEAFPML